MTERARLLWGFVNHTTFQITFQTVTQPGQGVPQAIAPRAKVALVDPAAGVPVPEADTPAAFATQHMSLAVDPLFEFRLASTPRVDGRIWGGFHLYRGELVSKRFPLMAFPQAYRMLEPWPVAGAPPTDLVISITGDSESSLRVNALALPKGGWIAVPSPKTGV